MALIYKSVLAVLALYVAYSSAATVTATNDLILGSHQYGETLFWQDKIAAKASVVGKKVIVEKTITAPANQLINYIECRDQEKNGAEAAITGGGTGFGYANLRFKSARFHGVYYNCVAYSKTRF